MEDAVVVIVTVGLPGSGKSMWSQSKASNDGFMRFNMDDTRSMLGFPSGSDAWDKDKEAFAFKVMLQGIVAAVASGYHVVIDNTHLNRTWATKYKQALQSFNVKWAVADFTDIPVEECILRDSHRVGLEEVGAERIKAMHRGYLKAKAEGRHITAEWLNEPLFDLKRYTGTPGKPKAILVDFDGTLALMDGRGPYEFWRVDEDKICKPVHMAVKMARAYGYKVIGCSGRDEGLAKEKTKLWMAKNAVVLDGLVMRKAGDRRRDDVVKHDLFWEFVAPQYDVEWVMDDRDRVVDVWRAMGIQCFQVAQGDF